MCASKYVASIIHNRARHWHFGMNVVAMVVVVHHIGATSRATPYNACLHQISSTFNIFIIDLPLMPHIAVKLYRSLHRVRRDYVKAQIPFVGIVGFNTIPALDLRTQLASAFRGAAMVHPGDAGRLGSDGFRALRQAQQQLQILKGSEVETREVRWYQGTEVLRLWDDWQQQSTVNPKLQNRLHPTLLTFSRSTWKHHSNI